MPAERLLAEAQRSLAAGDPRVALELLREAHYRDDKKDGLALWLFCASVQRARQLARKGMAQEAAAMADRALQHRAAIAVQELTEADLSHYLRHLEGSEAVAVYAARLATGPPLPAAERSVADRLVIDRCWERLDALAEDHLLRRDAAPVRASLEAMDGGDWPRAAELLQSVARRSPYAPWRLFCKAMVCFGAGDDRGLQRAVARLPEEFPLRHTVAEFKSTVTPTNGGGAMRRAVRRELGLEEAPVAALTTALRQAIADGRTPEIEQHLVKLADALGPDDPLRARLELVQIVSLAVLDDAVSPAAVKQLLYRLLPVKRAEGALAQCSLVTQCIARGYWAPAAAVSFFEALPDMFAGTADRALARACVLESLARVGAARRGDLDHLSETDVEALTILLGEPPADPGIVLINLMMASLAADPDHHAGFQFLLELIRSNVVQDRRRLQTLLSELAERYPAAPEPWLELATLHYFRNAYRRAETALAEARNRAPHDERVLDLQALGCIKAADQGRKSGHFRRAQQDLERAAAMRRPLVEPLLPIKHLMLEVVVAGAAGSAQAAAVVKPRLQGLSPALRLRTLARLLHELGENSHARNVRPEMEQSLRRLLAREIRALDQVAPEDALGLVAPLPEEVRLLYADLRIAPVLSRWWQPIMARLDADHLPACFDALLLSGGYDAVRSELDRRLRADRDARRNPMLLFYLAVVRYQQGLDYDGRRFAEVLERADAGARERLRAVAVRLAHVVDGPLQRALREFDFDLLDLPEAPPFAAPWFDDDFDDEDFDDEAPADLAGEDAANPAAALLPELPAALREAAAEGQLDLNGPQGLLFAEEVGKQLVEELEGILDKAAVRGAPRALLKQLASSMRGGAEMRETLDLAAHWCTAMGRRDILSRELEILLFPVGGGSRRRAGKK